MSEMFEVVENVPLRPINRAPTNTRRKYPIEGMKVGDWFFIPERIPKKVSAYISRISKDLPGKYSARRDWAQKNEAGKWRQCEDVAGATEGTGVWRIE